LSKRQAQGRIAGWKDVRWPEEAASGLHVRPHTSSLIQIGSIPQRQYCLIAIGP
jgi:hypothetical protein